jgi:hypothetical protein
MNPMLPPEGSFLNALKATDVDGYLRPLDKEMLVETLKFCFGPAQWWNAVAYNVMSKGALEKLDDDLRKEGGRYEILEGQTGLDQNYFGRKYPPTDQVKLYAATETGESYFLYEASKNLTFYVGPPNPPRYVGPPNPPRYKGNVKVINTLVLADDHKPLSSHTLDFGFIDREVPPPSDPIVGPVLAKFQPEEIDGPLELVEKEMLVAALRFYFGPAQFWKAVVDNKPSEDLSEVYTILEDQTGLGAKYFGYKHPPTDQVELYAVTNTRDPNYYRLPSYFLYEASKNLYFYVGPDLYHGEPWKTVINTQVLNDTHKSKSSHTLDFGFYHEF